MYERFKKFCEKKGVKPSNALKDLGISNSNAANWKSRNGLPNGQTVIKIADYFGITADEVPTGSWTGSTNVPLQKNRQTPTG